MKCIICEKSFKNVKNKDSKVCSRRCNAIRSSKEIAKSFINPKCKICGNETRRESRAKFCSNKCSGISRRKDGSKYIKSDGYIYMIVHGHPFTDKNNRMLEHRRVMELWMRENDSNSIFLVEINGEKYLMNGVVVHHKNGKKYDNRIENLELIESQSKHLEKHDYLLYSRKHLVLNKSGELRENPERTILSQAIQG